MVHVIDMAPPLFFFFFSFGRVEKRRVKRSTFIFFSLFCRKSDDVIHMVIQDNHSIQDIIQHTIKTVKNMYYIVYQKSLKDTN